MTSYTRRTLLNALPAIEGIVRNDLAAVVANAIDYQALLGDGSSNTPLGVRNAGVLDMTLATPSWATGARDADRHSGARRRPRQLGLGDDAAGGGAAANDRQGGQHRQRDADAKPRQLAGYPAFVTTLTVLGGSPQQEVVFFGAWSQLLVGYWSGLDVLVNPYSEDDYLRGRVTVRAMRDYDVAVRHPQAFAFAEDINVG